MITAANSTETITAARKAETITKATVEKITNATNGNATVNTNE